MKTTAPGGALLRLSVSSDRIAAMSFSGLLTSDGLAYSRDWAVAVLGCNFMPGAWVLDFRAALVALSAACMDAVVTQADGAVRQPGAIICSGAQMSEFRAHRHRMAAAGVIRAEFLMPAEAWLWIRWVLAAMKQAHGSAHL